MEDFEAYIIKIGGYYTINVILFTNRIKAEWKLESSSGFNLEYPEDKIITGNSFETCLLKHTLLYESTYLDYVSNDFSIYPTFIKVYSMSGNDTQFVLSDIKKIYDSLDPHLKMLSFEDFDIKFAIIG